MPLKYRGSASREQAPIRGHMTHVIGLGDLLRCGVEHIYFNTTMLRANSARPVRLSADADARLLEVRRTVEGSKVFHTKRKED